MKKNLLLTLIFTIAIAATSSAQFGIESKIRNKYKKQGKEHANKQKEKGEDKALEQAEKGYEAGEAKGMEEAEKGLDKAQPGLEKANDAVEEGEDYAVMGLTKYQEYLDGYDEQVASKDPADYKRYAFESAEVEYSLEGKDEGTKTVYIDMGGYKMAEYKSLKISKKKTENTAEVLLGAEMITMDVDEKQAVKMHNPLAFYLADQSRDWEKTAEKFLIKMGYEKIGKETISGKECDVWKNGGNKIWAWKGLALKSKYGKNIETATSIKIDNVVPNEKFEIPSGYEVEVVDIKDALPQFTDEEINSIKDEDVDEEEMLDMVEKMNYTEFKAWAKEADPSMSDDDIQQSYLYLKQKAKMRDK